MALKSGRVGIHPSQVDPITGMLLAGPSGTSDYEQLSNLPKVNSVTLKGNKSLPDLGIPTSLAGQSDTDITSPEQGQILQYNGTGWENVFASIAPTTLATLTDVTITDPAAGQTLEYNGTGWENVFASIAPTTLAALQDVNITSPADGDYLVYDSTSEKWINSGEAPAPTYTDVTCTFYGAVEDIISFTDAAGVSHLVTFAANASSKQETFKTDPSGSSITFTSSVAKNPDDLTEAYSKTVSVTSATTEIRVMPSNVLYWYGYINGVESCTSANGWSYPSLTAAGCTFNKNSISCASGSNTWAGVGCSSPLSGTKLHVIAQGLNGTPNYGSTIYNESSKVMSGSAPYVVYDSTSLKKYDITITSGKYFSCQSAYNKAAHIHAIWYE